MTDVPDFMPENLDGAEQSAAARELTQQGTLCNAMYRELMAACQRYSAVMTNTELIGTFELVRTILYDVIRTRTIEAMKAKSDDA